MFAWLTRLSEAVARWDALQQTTGYRLGGVAVGLAMCVGLLGIEPPAGLSTEAWRTLAIGLLMALWWLGGVLPITVTALVPLVAFPLMAVAPLKEVALPYAHPLIFLMLGGFLLGHAMERVGLHERLVAMLLTPEPLRATPRRVVLALMLSCGILSGLVSNTATTVMLLPLAVLLAQRCGADERGQSAFALALAYSASIGGVSTLVGTFPNAVLAQVAHEQAGIEVSFAKWSLLGVPYVVVALPVAWFLITRMMVPDSGKVPPPPEVPDWRPGEKAVLGVVVLAMLAWLTRRPVDLGFVRLPGWSEAVGFGAMVDDAWVAVFAGISLFLIPAEGKPLLSFREAERSLPWSVMFLLGGGFALANMIGASGLTEWLAGFTQHLAAVPTPLAVLLLCLLVTFLTELTSNTATTQILLPLLAAGAAKAGTDPMIWMVPATISASCAFMMPVATPPNAIAAEGAGVRPGDMATAGLLLNLTMVVITTVLMLGLVPLVFPSP